MRFSLRLNTICLATALLIGATSAALAQNQSFDTKFKSRLPGGVGGVATLSAGNEIYNIYVDSEFGDCGAWTATTGPSHPAGPDLNVLYGDGTPGTSNTILRSYSSGSEWATNNDCDDLCVAAGLGITTTATSITAVWSFVDGANTIEFTQEISAEVVGIGAATVENTVIRETHTVRNVAGPDYLYGLRKHWDWEIADNDGPWIGICDTPTLACDKSMNFQADGGGAGVPPPVYTINEDPGMPASCPDGVTPDSPLGCTGTPIYLVAGTTGPPSTLVPPPDAPELVQFNDWDELDESCWEPPLIDNAECGGGDTSLAYFYGRTAGSALTLAAGESRSFTQYVVASGSDGGCPDVIEPPALTLLKSADPTTYDTLGQTISYTYAVTNTGGSPVAGPMTVTDDKISGVSCPPMSSVGSGDMVLDPDETLECSGTYVIGEADFLNDSVTNIATASADGNQSNESTVTIVDDADASIDVTKTADPESVPPEGGLVTYTVEVVNTSDADYVYIDSIMDDTFEISPYDDCAYVSAFAGDSVTLPAQLPAGARIRCTFTGEVSGIPGTVHTNKVTATGSSDEGPGAHVDSATVEVVIEGDPLLVILESFTAERDGNGRIVLRWTTLAEIDSFGFRVFRAFEGEEPKRITGIIPSEGSELSGASYALRDRAPGRVGTLTYFLLEVDSGGFSSVIGTASIKVGVSIGGSGR